MRKPARRCFRLLSSLFASEAVREAVATRVRFAAGPEAVWSHLMFYEEVPGRPPFLLRALLPYPVRTEGDKTRVGALVRCSYSGGEVLKRITAAETQRSLRFEIIEQRLGIEGCALTLDGSYDIEVRGRATEVVLLTNYEAYLRPRFLWRPLEALLLGRVHRHILRGIQGAARVDMHDVRSAVTRFDAARSAAPSGFTAKRS